MKFVPLTIVVLFLLVFGYIGSGMISMYKNTIIKYNCDISEISPDYPIEVKQKCRELKYENRTSK